MYVAKESTRARFIKDLSCMLPNAYYLPVNECLRSVVVELFAFLHILIVDSSGPHIYLRKNLFNSHGRRVLQMQRRTVQELQLCERLLQIYWHLGRQFHLGVGLHHFR